jgi:predicted transcriptional regulator
MTFMIYFRRLRGILMPMTISITPAMEKKLSDIASLTNTDVGTVLENLLSGTVAVKLNRLTAIQKGLDDLEAGRTVDHEDVIREVLASIDE